MTSASLQNFGSILELSPPDLSIIVPTFNEVANVDPLLNRLASALRDINWQVVFVDDDSPDGTSELLAKRCRTNPRVRTLRRIGRRGLSSAITEGILSTSSPYVAVIDGDMQHDEKILGDMLHVLRSEDADLVIGSRYVAEGGVGDWDRKRRNISRFATLMAQMVVKADLADPMSGFFMIRRSAFDGAVYGLSNQGYKILLDIIASSPQPLRIRELPYIFRTRQHGESKLDALVALEYIALLLDKLIGKWVPVRFVIFAAIGAMGVLVHMAVLAGLYLSGLFPFAISQGVATVTAMVFNFFLNNVLTYRDRRLRGTIPILRGLASFCAVCAVGAVGNVGVANVLFVDHYSWWLAAFAGIAVGVVWNYCLSSIFTWRA